MSFASQEQALQSYVYVYSRLGQEVMPLSFSPLHSLLSERTDTCETVDRVGLAATDCESPAVYRSVSRPVVAAQSRRWLRLDHAFMQWLGPCIAVPALSPTCPPTPLCSSRENGECKRDTGRLPGHTPRLVRSALGIAGGGGHGVRGRRREEGDGGIPTGPLGIIMHGKRIHHSCV